MFLRGKEQVPCPDPSAGLYIRNRQGIFQKVSIPPDALAFQMGEASQVCSGSRAVCPGPQVSPKLSSKVSCWAMQFQPSTPGP